MATNNPAQRTVVKHGTQQQIWDPDHPGRRRAPERTLPENLRGQWLVV